MAVSGVVLATYNEADNLPSLVERLEGLAEDFHIYVVDDNSPDGTTAVAEELAGRYGNISVVTRRGKQGLGSALRTGIRAALKGGCRYVITMDADLSHVPEEVPRLLEAVASGEADMVQGSRYVEGGSTMGYRWNRRVVSRVANLAYHYLLGTPAEVTTSFRVYSRRSAEVVATYCRSDGFAFQPEAPLMLMNHALIIREVPITFVHRVAGKSKLDILQAISGLLFFIKALFIYRLKLGRFSRRSLADGL